MRKVSKRKQRIAQCDHYNNYGAVRWGGYCGEGGIVAVKKWRQGYTPSARDLCQFAQQRNGPSDCDLCLGLYEEGYWQLYETGDMAEGNTGDLRPVSYAELASLLLDPRKT